MHYLSRNKYYDCVNVVGSLNVEVGVETDSSLALSPEQTPSRVRIPRKMSLMIFYQPPLLSHFFGSSLSSTSRLNNRFSRLP